MKKNNLLLKNFSLLCLFLFVALQFQEVKAQFANGADIGWLSEMEDRGYIFKNNSGVIKNCLEILKEKGINSLRFRVWVNPRNKYCSKQDVAYMTQRADSMDFDIMINFHLSDWWADPGKQNKPAAWENHTVEELKMDIYNHVYDVLGTLKSLDVTPKWVQIGNEVGNGILWPEGSSNNMSNFAGFIQSGYNAVKDIDSSIQVIVQLENGHKTNRFREIFDGLKNNGTNWDIIGMSVYPYWANLPWQEDNRLSLETMKDMIARYDTKVMVCEAGYLYYKPVEANHYLVDLIEKTKSLDGLGVFYWEPQSYNWGYQLGAWDPVTKAPTVAMDAFLGIKVTSVDEQQAFSDYYLNIYPNPFNPNTTIEYTIPVSSVLSITIYDILGNEIKNIFNGFREAGHYKINFSAENIPSGVYFCRLNARDHTETKTITLLR